MVGWVKRSEPHQYVTAMMPGGARAAPVVPTLDPPYHLHFRQLR